MRHIKRLGLYCAIVVLLSAGTSARQGGRFHPRDWENPAVFRRNQEEPHTPLVPFQGLQQALRHDRKASPYYLSLNGTWKFSLSDVPEESPANFYKTDYDDSRWSDIHVPGNWQMQGFGHPLFRNVHQPFPATPPLPPSDYNPVGSYRRTFTIPESWTGRRVFLHFDGVKSASYLWINGAMAGYNQGGMEPAEYDITPYLKQGTNCLAVRVYRYSDGTYLECQDMWRLSGIYRDVYLMATPDVHMRDFYVTTDLDSASRDALLTVNVEVRNYGAVPADGYIVRAGLFDAAGKNLLAQPIVSARLDIRPGEVKETLLSRNIANPNKWSAEAPNLYSLVLELAAPDGKVSEILSGRVGFRKVEVKNQAIYINGAAVKFNGVNSHVHHPKTGRAMDIETMKKDLTLLKQFNINCVRTSHYPPEVDYLDLADQYGMYIVDETGDEAHATEYISKDPAWRAAYVDRGRRMVKRDRNHPSVVIWSAGNESGSGDNIAALIKEGKKIDPSRPAWLYGGNEDLLPFEDIVGPRYPTPEELARVGQVPPERDPRPSFMDEYLAVTGNGLGNLDEFWDVIYRYPRLTGGAIWDLVSPGITSHWRTTPDRSANKVQTSLMASARLVEGRFGNAVALSGHDDWVEVYHHPALDITGDQLTLDVWVYPRIWNGTSPFVTKGNQYGLAQSGRNTLELYIQDGGKISITAPVPEKWELRWHHLAGTYDGSALHLYLDGKELAAKEHRGRIARGYFPVNIGRNAEIHGQEHPGELCNAVIDQVRIYARALSPQELENPSEEIVSTAALALDFDEAEDRGEFFFLGIGARAYGLIWPDRTIQPEMWQLKKTPQPVKIEAIDIQKGLVKITNRYNFTNLRELNASWLLTAEGETLQHGSLAVDIAPGQSREVRIPFDAPKTQIGVQCRLLLSFSLPKDTNWAARGHEVAWEQFELPFAALAPARPLQGRLPELSLRESGDGVTITGSDFGYIFDKRKGTLVSALLKGKEFLKSGPKLDVWRAPLWNETERQWGPKPIVDQWRAFGLDRLLTQVTGSSTAKEKGRVLINVGTRSAAEGVNSGFESVYTYTFFPTGDVLIDHRVVSFGNMPDWLPKIGMQITLMDEFQRFQWYGRGPMETYPDRKTGMKVGVYSGTVDEQFSPYLVPEDYGNKTDVRWAALSNGTVGLLVQGKELLNVSAQHYDTDNLTRALYPPQLRKQDGITLNIDPVVSGVGDTPRKVLKKYRVLPGEYRYSVRLRPFRKGEQPASLARENVF